MNTQIANICIFTLILVTANTFSQNEDILNIETGDAKRVTIEITENPAPSTQVFLKYEKLKEAQQLISNNYKKKIIVQINGNTISTPIIQIEPPFKGQSIALSYDTIPEAVNAAKELMNTVEQGAAANP